MNIQHPQTSKVFAEMPTEPVISGALPDLSRKVVFNNAENPVCNVDYGKDVSYLDFLECGAEETVETDVDTPIQESLVVTGVVESMLKYSDGPVQSVKQKFEKPVETPEYILDKKYNGKHLAPRQDVPPLVDQTEATRKNDVNQGIQEETFTQKLDVAADMLRGIGIDIKPGACNGPLGIVHIRSKDNFEKISKAEKEKLEPVDKFKSNEIVYGTHNALVDLVKYHKDPMFSTGATGVYTDKNYRFLGWSYRTPEKYCDVRFTQFLGKGSFGSVELWQVQNHRYFVKKKIHQDNFCQNEVLLTLGLQHPNILKTYGFIINQDYREIIMEYAGESLLSYSMREHRPEKIIWDVSYFALEGLKYLHDNNIIHFDVKPENILIKEGSDGLDVTIADLGSAQKMGGESLEPKSMTYEYSAPELCRDYIKKRLPNKKFFASADTDNGQIITGKVDMFALGLTVMFPYGKSHVMIKTFTGLDSYATIERPEYIRLQMTLALAANPNLVQDLIPDNVGQNMKDLILGLTKGDAKERLDAGQAIKLMRDISLKAEAARQIETVQNTKDVRRSSSRKVKSARRRSSGGTTLDNSQKEKCQGIDMSLITQESNAILEENSQLKHRVVRGLLKRKLCESVPSTGKQMRPNPETGNQNLGRNLELEEKAVELEKPANLPNLDFLF